MLFVPAEDPREVIKAIKTNSEKKWLAFRDEDVDFLVNGPLLNERSTLIGRDGFVFSRSLLINDMAFENGREEPPKVSSPEPFYKPKKKDPKNKIDAVKISEQKIRIVGDTVIETGRSVATRASQEEAVWDVRYTSVWGRYGKSEWQLMSEQQTTVK